MFWLNGRANRLIVKPQKQFDEPLRAVSLVGNQNPPIIRHGEQPAIEELVMQHRQS
jgi:hypothetical protein